MRIRSKKWLSSDFLEERVVPDLAEQANLYQGHLARYRLAINYIKDKKVLDAGCGCGYGAHLLAKKGAKKVVGVDNSEEALAYCKDRYQAPNLSFKKMDCTRLNFADESFDAIVSFEVIEHLKNQVAFSKEMKRVLTKKGIFIISTPNAKDKSSVKSKFHFREYNPGQLRRLLKKYFSDVTLYGQRFNPLLIKNSEEKAKQLAGASKILGKYIPDSLKNYIYSKFFNKYLLSVGVDDILIEKEKFEGTGNIIGVCYK
jgi:2-polyprenyl-3-methyl-5-hydroxy-6-metoxy-1,4-benzoquinol methylase